MSDHPTILGDDAESREASCCDLLDSWAREIGVMPSTRQEECRTVARRLWGKTSTMIEELRGERDKARQHARDHHLEPCETCAAVVAERDEAIANNLISYCVYCGITQNHASMETREEAMTEHTIHCEKRPEPILLDALEQVLWAARWALSRLGDPPDFTGEIVDYERAKAIVDAYAPKGNAG